MNIVLKKDKSKVIVGKIKNKDRIRRCKQLFSNNILGYCFFLPNLTATPLLVLILLSAWPVDSGAEVTSNVWPSPVTSRPAWNTPPQRPPIGYLETSHSTIAQMATAWQTTPSSSAMPRASGFPRKVRPCPIVSLISVKNPLLFPTASWNLWAKQNLQQAQLWASNAWRVSSWTPQRRLSVCEAGSGSLPPCPSDASLCAVGSRPASWMAMQLGQTTVLEPWWLIAATGASTSKGRRRALAKPQDSGAAPYPAATLCLAVSPRRSRTAS